MVIEGSKKVLIFIVLLVSAVIFLFLLDHGTSSGGNSRASSLLQSTISGTTGLLFKMQKVRVFPVSQLKKTPVSVDPKTWGEGGKTCRQWAVSTTIWEPSKTLHQIAALKTWCLVVVLDKKSPKDFNVPNAVILTPEDQTKLGYRILKHLPWNHFGRKNVGFLYAVAHGAEVIYDCDDDNELMLSDDDTNSIPLDMGPRVLSSQAGLGVFNPYPSFGNVGGWPRGYPLDQIMNASTLKTQGEEHNVVKQNNFWVHQSLANNDPDYDAIYRLTRPLPVTFAQKPPIAVATGTMTPYNAQATLHFRPAFWGMLLPITVHGRVSDIWRSYFTQRLLWDIGGQIVFRPPWVVQYRNAHNYLADFDSEYDLYRKATGLVEFLRHWDCEERTVKRRYLKMMIEMYEYGILGHADVLLMNDWLLDLTSAGYTFPTMTEQWQQTHPTPAQ